MIRQLAINDEKLVAFYVYRPFEIKITKEIKNAVTFNFEPNDVMIFGDGTLIQTDFDNYQAHYAPSEG